MKSWPDLLRSGGGAGAPAPSVGSVPGAAGCGANTADSSPDVFWRSDDPGAANASTALTASDARSTAVLSLPAGATVTHAFLYWAARRAATTADTSIVFERPEAFTQNVEAVSSYLVEQPFDVIPEPFNTDVVYQSVANVTTLVRAHGSGPYRVSGVDARSSVGANYDVLFAGWSLVVLYQLDSDPPRNLAVFDGLDHVSAGAPSAISLNGFLVPNAGFDATLGAIVYEGDEFYDGDSLYFGSAPLAADDLLSDAINPENNFFNGTRSEVGSAVSTSGDLPRVSGAASTLAGMDLDVVDVSSRLRPGQTSVDIEATSYDHEMTWS